MAKHLESEINFRIQIFLVTLSVLNIENHNPNS